MRLIIIRHGDPDYTIDSLTEQGWKEAELLVPRISSLDVKEFYVSPLGRAGDTASLTLKAMNRTAVVCDWLREFPVQVDITDNTVLQKAYPDHRIVNDRIYANTCWDILPEYWAEHPEYSHREDWKKSEIASCSDMVECYDYVTKNFDLLLEKHGYKREDNHYRAISPNRDTIIFFCHFGLECVLLSHLMGVSPFNLWHGTALAPTSVTTIYTEERREGIACFRAAHLGDISHLAAAGIKPSFSARFCETYDNMEERH